MYMLMVIWLAGSATNLLPYAVRMECCILWSQKSSPLLREVSSVLLFSTSCNAIVHH